ncbi:MFS transporter [Duganella sp. FT135W]|uniref:MFS transporter n=1 Tax=Duganella flavida TaxID=2692175 RepID=A0A6L8K8E2_9BURK|nr:MFS transporter [Duganella flavida]MYM23636.1 MFS transporter [Duganella flavida]
MSAQLNPAPVAEPVVAAAPAEEGYLLGKGATLRVFTLLCLLMVFDFADRMIIASLLPSIRAEWLITDAQAGLLSSVLFIGMVLFAFPAVALTNRLGRIKTASLMGIFWSITSAAGALAGNITQLAATRAAVGIGEAGYAPASYAWISAAFPKRRRQLALGLFSSGQVIGMALGVALGGYIGSRFGWRHALGLMALPGLLVAVLLYRGRDYKSIAVAAPTQDRRHLKVIFSTPSLVLAFLSQGFATLQQVPIFYFLPTFFNRVHGIPMHTASYMTSGLLFLAIIAVPLGGWIMDRWSGHAPLRKLSFAPALAVMGTAIYAIAFGLVQDANLQYGLILVAFFTYGLGGVATLGMTQDLVAPDLRPLSATCSIIAIHLLGSAPGPFIAGLLSDRYGLANALLATVFISTALSVSALLLARRYYLADLAKVGKYKLEPA